MAKYELIDPSISKLTELCFLVHELRYNEKMFSEFRDSLNENAAFAWRKKLDDWMAENLKKVPK